MTTQHDIAPLLDINSLWKVFFLHIKLHLKDVSLVSEAGDDIKRWHYMQPFLQLLADTFVSWGGDRNDLVALLGDLLGDETYYPACAYLVWCYGDYSQAICIASGIENSFPVNVGLESSTTARRNSVYRVLFAATCVGLLDRTCLRVIIRDSSQMGVGTALVPEDGVEDALFNLEQLQLQPICVNVTRIMKGLFHLRDAYKLEPIDVEELLALPPSMLDNLKEAASLVAASFDSPTEATQYFDSSDFTNRLIGHLRSKSADNACADDAVLVESLCPPHVVVSATADVDRIAETPDPRSPVVIDDSSVALCSSPPLKLAPADGEDKGVAETPPGPSKHIQSGVKEFYSLLADANQELYKDLLMKTETGQWVNDELLLLATAFIFCETTVQDWTEEVGTMKWQRVNAITAEYCVLNCTSFHQMKMNDAHFAKESVLLSEMRLLTIPVVLIPVNIRDNHWVLCVMHNNLDDKPCLHWLDSLKARSVDKDTVSDIWRCFSRLWDSLALVVGFDKLPKFRNVNNADNPFYHSSTSVCCATLCTGFPQQTNNDDCGVFVGMAMQLLAHSCKDMETMRLQLALNLPATFFSLDQAGMLFSVGMHNVPRFRQKMRLYVLLALAIDLGYVVEGSNGFHFVRHTSRDGGIKEELRRQVEFRIVACKTRVLADTLVLPLSGLWEAFPPRVAGKPSIKDRSGNLCFLSTAIVVLQATGMLRALHSEVAARARLIELKSQLSGSVATPSSQVYRALDALVDILAIGEHLSNGYDVAVAAADFKAILQCCLDLQVHSVFGIGTADLSALSVRQHSVDETIQALYSATNAAFGAAIGAPSFTPMVVAGGVSRSLSIAVLHSKLRSARQEYASSISSSVLFQLVTTVQGPCGHWHHRFYYGTTMYLAAYGSNSYFIGEGLDSVTHVVELLRRYLCSLLEVAPCPVPSADGGTECETRILGEDTPIAFNFGHLPPVLHLSIVCELPGGGLKAEKVSFSRHIDLAPFFFPGNKEFHDQLDCSPCTIYELTTASLHHGTSHTSGHYITGVINADGSVDVHDTTASGGGLVRHYICLQEFARTFNSRNALCYATYKQCSARPEHLDTTPISPPLSTRQKHRVDAPPPPPRAAPAPPAPAPPSDDARGNGKETTYQTCTDNAHAQSYDVTGSVTYDGELGSDAPQSARLAAAAAFGIVDDAARHPGMRNRQHGDVRVAPNHNHRLPPDKNDLFGLHKCQGPEYVNRANVGAAADAAGQKFSPCFPDDDLQTPSGVGATPEVPATHGRNRFITVDRIEECLDTHPRDVAAGRKRAVPWSQPVEGSGAKRGLTSPTYTARVSTPRTVLGNNIRQACVLMEVQENGQNHQELIIQYCLTETQRAIFKTKGGTVVPDWNTPQVPQGKDRVVVFNTLHEALIALVVMRGVVLGYATVIADKMGHVIPDEQGVRGYYNETLLCADVTKVLVKVEYVTENVALIGEHVRDWIAAAKKRGVKRAKDVLTANPNNTNEWKSKFRWGQMHPCFFAVYKSITGVHGDGFNKLHPVRELSALVNVEVLLD